MNKRKIFQAWTFFRRGHGVYLVFIMSFLNFLVIQWRLLFQKVVVLNEIFQRFYIFSIIFISIYVPAAVFIGWMDYRRGSVSTDQTESARANPYGKDLAKALICIAQEKNDKAIAILKKWT